MKLLIKKSCAVLPLILMLALAAAAQNPASPSKPNPGIVVIHAGTLIDGVSSEPRQNQYIVVRNNRIESVGAETPNFPGAEAIDLSRATVLPGLIDSHTHMFLQGEDPAL